MNRCFRVALLIATVLSLCVGCVGLPDSGEVQVGPDRAASAQNSGYPYDPRPPQQGEDATEIVGHFLDAMMANPPTTTVARQFLSEQAREAWRPDRGLITYDDILTPSGSNEVSVTLLNAHHLDERGVWRGAVAEDRDTLDFAMTVEGGEWRIDGPPNAMIVSDEFFEAHYRQVSLYFLDPTAQVVVPEPVFVPRAGQLSTVLMRALLLDPDPLSRGVTRSFIPEDLSLDLSPPVSAEGLAEVSLRGDGAVLDAESLELMTVQVAWTLRQDPSVRRIRLSINDTPVTVSGSSSDFDVDIGRAYDPLGADAWQDLFALREGRMISSVGGGETRVAGPFGARDYPLGSISVSVEGDRAAGVTSDGSAILLAPVDTDGDIAAKPVITGESNLLKPVWDITGRLWTVDRTPQGAAVSYLLKGRRKRVQVPGVSGERVSKFLVSRDGTRLVVVLNRPRGDVVAQSRLVLDDSRLRGRRATVIHRDVGEKVQIRDIAWNSPTEVAMTRVISGELSQISTFSVDGSRAVQSREVPIELVRDKIVDLVSSPDPGAATWAIAASGRVYELSAQGNASAPAEGLESLTYVG